MKIKTITFLLLSSCLTFSNVRAQDTIFGESGSGQPTKTVIGILGGAALGAGIGGIAGGADAPWIGALVGSAVGGVAGNQWGAATAWEDHEYHPPRAKRVVYRDGVPYGYMSHGEVRSPWSNFEMSIGGKAPGQIVYDPNTGQPFRVP